MTIIDQDQINEHQINNKQDTNSFRFQSQKLFNLLAKGMDQDGEEREIFISQMVVLGIILIPITLLLICISMGLRCYAGLKENVKYMD